MCLTRCSSYLFSPLLCFAGCTHIRLYFDTAQLSCSPCVPAGGRPPQPPPDRESDLMSTWTCAQQSRHTVPLKMLMLQHPVWVSTLLTASLRSSGASSVTAMLTGLRIFRYGRTSQDGKSSCDLIKADSPCTTILRNCAYLTVCSSTTRSAT